jgi:hypothetical protein
VTVLGRTDKENWRSHVHPQGSSRNFEILLKRETKEAAGVCIATEQIILVRSMVIISILILHGVLEKLLSLSSLVRSNLVPMRLLFLLQVTASPSRVTVFVWLFEGMFSWDHLSYKHTLEIDSFPCHRMFINHSCLFLESKVILDKSDWRKHS